MKNQVFILLLQFSITLSVYAGNRDPVVIHGKIIGFVPERLEYVIPINGYPFPGFRDPVKWDSTGSFEIQLQLEQPAFILIYASGFTSVIIAEPGESYQVAFEQKAGKMSVIISGPNEAGQNLYNKLPSPYLVQMEFSKYSADTLFRDFSETVKLQKAGQVNLFKQLLNEGKISESFFQQVMIDRNCYYSTLLSTFPLIKLYRGNTEKPGDFPSELKNQWDQLFAENPPTNPSNLLSPRWYEYAKYFLEYHLFLDDSFDFNKLNKIWKDKLINTYKIELAEQWLTGKMLETYEASFIYEGCLQKDFEKEWLDIYSRFKTKYPQSISIPYLETLVSPIADYHKANKSGFSKNMRFIDNPDKITTLSECLEKLRGKKIYIDVWATWCGPCKDEFKYKDSLNSLLRSKGFEILYISIDKAEKDNQWKEMIKYYNLEGYHIRTNKEFSADMYRLFDKNGSISIPWYLLIDERGKIIDKDASRPSEIEQLKKDLEKL
jgi:thiol-disulfide isomerase/thioredoxin